jgi:gliding motility-associated-like protein
VQFAEAAADSVASCTWAFGDGDSANVFEPLHVYEDPGTYDVTLAVTLADGCRYDTTYQDLVVVSETPVAAFTANPQPATPDDTEISFTDQSSGGVTAWIWDFDSIPPFTSTDSDPTVTFPAIPGEYPVVLVVTNAAGCTDTLRSSIRVESNGDITLPNVFTPNGDGVNDRFLPLEQYPGNWRLTMLNRWGQQVFATNRVTEGWNGADAPDGIYFWTLEALEGQVNPLRSGYVALLRGR